MKCVKVICSITCLQFCLTSLTYLLNQLEVVRCCMLTLGDGSSLSGCSKVVLCVCGNISVLDLVLNC